jgi:hypothetical protein
MGREVKRVALDFDWPLDEVWEGFLLPGRLHERPCPDCDYSRQETVMDRLFPSSGGHSTGYSPEAHAIAQTFYPHMIASGSRAHDEALAWHDKLGQAEVDNLVAEGRLRELRKREPAGDNPRDREWVSVPRSAAEVNEANRKPGPGGHDGINRMILVSFRCERLGITVECATCHGHASLEAYPGQRAEAEAWEPQEPPAGEGWQLWETVSEGSPISPVLTTAGELAAWMSDPARGRDWLTPEAAAKFVASGWAPTFMSTPETGLVSGAECIGTHDAGES